MVSESIDVSTKFKHLNSILLTLQKKVKAEELVDDAHRDSDVHEGDFFSLFYYDECERSNDRYSLKVKQKVSLSHLRRSFDMMTSEVVLSGCDSGRVI